MRVPILCYHRIEVPRHDPRDTNFVSPALFARHLRLLARLGYTGVTVRDVLRWQTGQQPLPPRPVVFSFDDAYASVADEALPHLEARGWRGTVYVVSGELGGRNRWDPAAPPATLLDVAALRAAMARGHDVGSHTHRHRRIRGLARPEAREEVAGSKQALEQALGVPCEHFAFPYGSHDRRDLDLVRDAGYRGAVTLKRWANGRRTNPLRLGRLSVGGPLPPWALAAKLAKLYCTPVLS